ncbi:MAG TPA: nitroreductase family protein [Acidimicrobiales bacterium]|jgi:nitroreductase
MELRDGLRTTGSVRTFTAQPIDDAVLFDVLDDARFAPSGGNRQAWRVIVVRDAEQRRQLSAAYLNAWHDYVASLLAGVTPFSPLASDEEREAVTAKRVAAEAQSAPDGFAETLDEAPALLLVVADLAAFAATDRDLDRYHLVGGASVYPFIWSLLLAAHERGLGGVMTTVATANEPRLREIFSLPSTFVVASLVVLGYPERRATKLRRREVPEFTFVDRFGGPAFRP